MKCLKLFSKKQTCFLITLSLTTCLFPPQKPPYMAFPLIPYSKKTEIPKLAKSGKDLKKSFFVFCPVLFLQHKINHHFIFLVLSYLGNLHSIHIINGVKDQAFDHLYPYYSHSSQTSFLVNSRNFADVHLLDQTDNKDSD